jgi:peroxiredoxin
MIKQFHKILIIALLILMYAANLNAIEFKEESDTYEVGDVVKDFTLKNALTNEPFSFDRDIKGKNKATAIIFMTTTCSACKAEMALLSDFANEYSGKEGFKFYAVSVDLDGEKTVPAYEEEYSFNATYLLDPEFTIPQQFGFVYTPGLIIINRIGEVSYMKGGYSPAAIQEVLAALKAALR